jgi:ketosteroid isomerase-like protein
MRAPSDVVQELVAAYNAKSLDVVLDLYRPDARFWDPFHREGVVGREAIGEVVGGLFESFPDEEMSIETLAADETHAVAEFRSTGTARGGEPFEVEFTEVYEVTDGQVASCRVYIDTEALPLPHEGAERERRRT